MAALHLSADLVGVRMGAPTFERGNGCYWDRPANWITTAEGQKQTSAAGVKVAGAAMSLGLHSDEERTPGGYF